MGQGLYRCVGFGCINPPRIDWDDMNLGRLYDVVKTSYEAVPDYVMVPFGIDDGFLMAENNLPPLPKGLPHVEPRTAVVVPRCSWWPDVGKSGVWVSARVVETWEMVRRAMGELGVVLPEGEPIFVCDWD